MGLDNVVPIQLCPNSNTCYLKSKQNKILPQSEEEDGNLALLLGAGQAWRPMDLVRPYLLMTNWMLLLASRIFRSLAIPKQLGLRREMPSGSPTTNSSSGYIRNLE